MRKKALLVMILIGSMLFAVAGYSETIYTKDGQVIQGKIDEIDEETVWVEITTEGDITEYIGIDKIDVEKILNDDGSKYSYSQTDKKQEAGSEKD